MPFKFFSKYGRLSQFEYADNGIWNGLVNPLELYVLYLEYRQLQSLNLLTVPLPLPERVALILNFN